MNRKRKAESGKRTAGPRRGLTLVELLIAIAIISVLAALLIGVAATAGATARESRTKSFVARLHTLLIERHDLYRTRRVELNDNWEANLVLRFGSSGNSDLTGMWVDNMPPEHRPAAGRLAALREMMKIEMPDRWSDIALWNPNLPTALPPTDDAPLPPILPGEIPPRLAFVSEAPPLHAAYLRRYNAMAAAGVTAGEARENQSAECLYLTIMYATADGEARSLFRETDVGDTDEDGALEFLDGWGNPINYLRWAPGFESDAQASVKSLIDLYDDAESDTDDIGLSGTEAVRLRLTEDHDPLDLFRVDWANLNAFTPSGGYVGARGWRLTPLVVSAGLDEEFGLRFDEEWVAKADPYADVDPATGTQSLGERTDPEAYADNLHSHDIGSFTRAR